MMRTKSKVRALALATGIAGLALTQGPALAVDKITAVHAFPPFLVYTKTFLAVVEDINNKGKGVVEITVKGGPEAIGMFEQPNAVRDGVVDMVHTPGSFYSKSVPEIDAMVASKNNAPDVRANGGAALMDQAHQKRFNVKHLGWIDSGVHFHIYSVPEPKYDADGVLDLSGVKLRDNPIYHAFFEALKATTSSMPSTEVYSALEKGVVEASAWPSIGVMDLKWDKFLKYRNDPSFYTTDLGIIINLDKWNSLSDESKKLIQDTIIEWETKSMNARAEQLRQEEAELKKRGMKFVSMNEAGGAKYQKMANDAAWSRMKGRLDAMNSTEFYDGLRKAYLGE